MNRRDIFKLAIAAPVAALLGIAIKKLPKPPKKPCCHDWFTYWWNDPREDVYCDASNGTSWTSNTTNNLPMIVWCGVCGEQLLPERRHNGRASIES